jgi:hypothetical protein
MTLIGRYCEPVYNWQSSYGTLHRPIHPAMRTFQLSVSVGKSVLLCALLLAQTPYVVVGLLPVARVPAIHLNSPARQECQVQAWVRAADLVPAELVRGEVKVKTSGDCDDAISYELGLRFRERSAFKVP